MKSGARAWMVRLTANAENDFEDILRWTASQFGERQARRYAGILSSAIGELAAGPVATGVKERNEIMTGLHTLHIARRGRNARHFVMFRVADEQSGQFIEVLRILHDGMDLARHVSRESER
jgi:toxin ParE1/3/4